MGNVSLATKVKRQVFDFMEEAGLHTPEGGVQVQVGGSTDKDFKGESQPSLRRETLKVQCVCWLRPRVWHHKMMHHLRRSDR